MAGAHIKGSDVQITNRDGLDILVFANAILAPFTAHPALLDSAKGALGSADQARIDANHAAIQSPSDSHDAPNVLAEEVPRESVLGSVSHLHSLVLTRKGKDGRERAESLVNSHLHLAIGVADDGGLVEISAKTIRPLSTRVQDGAFADSVANMRIDLVHGSSIDKWTLSDPLVDASAQFQCPDPLHELRDELVLDLFVYQQSICAL